MRRLCGLLVFVSAAAFAGCAPAPAAGGRSRNQGGPAAAPHRPASAPAPAAAPSPAPPPLPPPAPEASPAPIPLPTAAAPSPKAPCFNTQYKLTCVLPDGYVITDEADGPGTIMTITQRVKLVSEEPANATVKINPLGKRTLEKYFDGRVVGPLSSTEGVTGVVTSTAAYGLFEGFEVVADRQYASGQFRSKAFAFAQGPNAVVVTVSSPVPFFEKAAEFIPAFVPSLIFQP